MRKRIELTMDEDLLNVLKKKRLNISRLAESLLYNFKSSRAHHLFGYINIPLKSGLFLRNVYILTNLGVLKKWNH